MLYEKVLPLRMENDGLFARTEMIRGCILPNFEIIDDPDDFMV